MEVKGPYRDADLLGLRFHRVNTLALRLVRKGLIKLFSDLHVG